MCLVPSGDARVNSRIFRPFVLVDTCAREYTQVLVRECASGVQVRVYLSDSLFVRKLAFPHGPLPRTQLD